MMLGSLAVLASAAVSLAFGSWIDGAATRGRICGSSMSEAESRAVERKFSQIRPAAGGDYPAQDIAVWFHVITGGPYRDDAVQDTFKNGTLSTKQIQDQIQILNDGFQTANLSFTLADITDYHNATWFDRATKNSPEEREMKQHHFNPNEVGLHIYSVGFIEDTFGGQTLGYASFPGDDTGNNSFLDGVVIRFTTLPENSEEFSPFNEGKTLTHEVGHWAGLLHPYEGGCSGTDGVDDTPPQMFPTYGCSLQDAELCPGVTPEDATEMSHNFMDNSNDECVTEFTPGQVALMRALLAEYRGIPENAPQSSI